ncbi:DUF6498-containing protein [Flavobacterium sp.]|uniref:DUF6498-containing protein n=1 Tax=Flavobacterium sp. TaxID=239 RepID=UPI003F6A02C9
MNLPFLQNQSKTNNVILINAVFLIALLLSGKANPMAIVFAYVFETIIIGIIHAVKLFYIIRYDNEPGKVETKLINFASIFFFLIHYGFFVAIQSIFLYVAFAINDDRFSTSLNPNNFLVIFKLEGFYLVAISVILTHLVEFYFNFLKNKKYLNQNFGSYFSKPYLRIFIQQFLAIIPSFFLFFTDHVGIIAALLLILMRAFLDIYMNQIAKNPQKIKKIAKFLTKAKPEEYEKTEKIVTSFFE